MRTWLLVGWLGLVLVACGPDEPESFEIDGELDCRPGVITIVQAGTDPEADGDETAYQAAQLVLEEASEVHGGGIVITSPSSFSVVVDGREILVTTATEYQKGWFVNGWQNCPGFDIFESD